MRTCPGCGVEEHRTKDDRGRETVNLDPFTGKCIPCLAKAAASSHTFTSRRDDHQGEVVDVRKLAAGDRE